jgi:hypothetical protein
VRYRLSSHPAGAGLWLSDSSTGACSSLAQQRRTASMSGLPTSHLPGLLAGLVNHTTAMVPVSLPPSAAAFVGGASPLAQLRVEGLASPTTPSGLSNLAHLGPGSGSAAPSGAAPARAAAPGGGSRTPGGGAGAGGAKGPRQFVYLGQLYGSEVVGRKCCVQVVRGGQRVFEKATVVDFSEASGQHRMQHSATRAEQWVSLGDIRFYWRDAAPYEAPPNPTFRPQHGGEGAVGKRLRVYWPAMQKWYCGSVKSYDPLTGSHSIYYKVRLGRVLCVCVCVCVCVTMLCTRGTRCVRVLQPRVAAGPHTWWPLC